MDEPIEVAALLKTDLSTRSCDKDAVLARIERQKLFMQTLAPGSDAHRSATEVLALFHKTLDAMDWASVAGRVLH